MPTSEIEIRVKKLEKEVDLIKSRIDEPDWWKKITGTFAGDKAHETAMKLGRKYRSSQTAKNGNDNS